MIEKIFFFLVKMVGRYCLDEVFRYVVVGMNFLFVIDYLLENKRLFLFFVLYC